MSDSVRPHGPATDSLSESLTEPLTHTSRSPHDRNKGTREQGSEGREDGGHPSMNPTGPRATSRPVDNPPADAVEVMDGDGSDTALFGGYEPPSSDTEGLSAGRRLTLRQAAQVAAGIHPLTLNYTLPLRLHPDAERTRTVDSAQDGTPTCGSCALRAHFGHHTRSYPKCTRPGAPVSAGPATDVRAWWPGCEHHVPKAGA